MEGDRDQAQEERSARLIADAAKVLWTYGVKSMTMDDISMRLGISKKTLYQYVKDKNDLVEKVLEHISREFKCDVDESTGAGKNAIDELFAITTRVSAQMRDIHPAIIFDLEKYHPEAFRAMMRNKRQEIYTITTDNMQRGIEEGLYRADLNIPIIANIYIARFDVVIDGEVFPPDRFDRNQVYWEILRYHVRGIASPKGLKYLEKKLSSEKTAGPQAPRSA